MDVREIADRLISIMFPKRCLNCCEVVCYDDMFCENCGYEKVGAEFCRKKMGGVPVGGAVAGMFFSGGAQKAVWTIKDKRDVRIRNFFAAAIHEEIQKSWAGVVFDYVTPVPLNDVKLKKRGFNQAGIIAEKLAELLGVPYIDNALIQDNASMAQHTLNAEQRRENAAKSFHAGECGQIRGKTVLIVDDVMTTGATLRVCASLLLDNGAKEVYAAAASTTPDDG